jgi:hypothetical protein
VFGRNSSFGATQERFGFGGNPSAVIKATSSSARNDDLGPGLYEPGNVSSIRHAKKPLSVFVSATKRFSSEGAGGLKRVEEEKQSLMSNPPSSVDSSQSAPLLGMSNAHSYGHPAARGTGSSSFSSASGPRFNERALRQSRALSEHIGPGSYSGHNQANYANVYRTAVGVQSSFKSTEREQGGGMYKRERGPGPGAYTRDVTHPQNSQFIKRSFNITIATDV